jgi:hypothetical protein
MDDGRWDEAEALFTEVVERGRLSGVDHAVGEALKCLGYLAARDGDRQRSVELMGQAVDQYRRARDSWQLCRALDALAGARSAAGDPGGAADVLRESLDLAEECGFEHRLGRTLLEIALVLPDDLRDIGSRLYALWPCPDPHPLPPAERQARLQQLATDHGDHEGPTDPQALRDAIPLAREALAREL